MTTLDTTRGTGSASPSGSAAAWAEHRTRRQAQFTALRRHPLRWAWRRLRPEPGHRAPTAPPTSRRDILARLNDLPLSVWTYGWDRDQIRHLGPMAQDFAAAFGLGGSDRRIDMVDAAGVCMAALQALTERLTDAEAELAALRQLLTRSCPAAAPGPTRARLSPRPSPLDHERPRLRRP